MGINHLAYALLGVALLAGLLSRVASRNKEATQAGPVSSYLLAGGSLGRVSVLSLLMSSSFGLNSLFYAAWLGYSIGIWALLVQAAWSVSFFLLAKYAGRIRSHKSMHHLLGSDFGPVTRVVAGLCSLIGMMYLIGWEVEITRLTFDNVLGADAVASDNRAATISGVIAAGTVAACLLYTVLGGLRGNALADKALNMAKLLCVLAIIFVLCIVANSSPEFSLASALFPSRNALMINMGLFGFATNIVFNLAWQFVDASSWQSIIAGRQAQENDARKNLIASGLAIFVIPGIIGTVLGVVAHGFSDVTGDNIIARASLVATSISPIMAIVAAIMIVACVMSLLDGMFLACAFTLVVDIVYPKRSLESLEDTPLRAEFILVWTRVALVAIALVSALGVHWLMELLQVSVFQFVYVVIITQLGLLGPILIGLKGSRVPRVSMSIAIVLAVTVGFACAWQGTHGWNPHWSDAAGTITAFVSVVLALVLSRKRPLPLPLEITI